MSSADIPELLPDQLRALRPKRLPRIAADGHQTDFHLHRQLPDQIGAEDQRAREDRHDRDLPFLRVAAKKVVGDLLKWVGLGERMDALPPVLSGGEKQRAAIARAVISRPLLLLADEPTGNVDPTLGRRLLRLFIELNKSGTAVVIATHDITLMDQYDARRLVLHQGRLHIYE